MVALPAVTGFEFEYAGVPVMVMNPALCTALAWTALKAEAGLFMTCTEIHAEISAQRERERRAMIVENCLLLCNCMRYGRAILTLANKWHRVGCWQTGNDLWTFKSVTC